MKKHLFKTLVFFFLIGSGSIQAQKTLSLQSITPLTAILIGDTGQFEVNVGVQNWLTSLPDSIDGDIFYWWQTDQMVLDGVPPRKIEQDFVIEHITDGFYDVVHVDIRPDEIRTEPANLIILWPAIIDTSIRDTTGISFYLTPDGVHEVQQQLGGIGSSGGHNENILFPCPALQFLYIQPGEIKLIKAIQIWSIHGELAARFESGDFQNGSISLDSFASGEYIVELNYYDNSVHKTKIMKQ